MNLAVDKDSRKAGAKRKTSWDKEREYKRLDFSKIQFEKEELSTEESLEEIIPIKWSQAVLNGERKVLIKKQS